MGSLTSVLPTILSGAGLPAALVGIGLDVVARPADLAVPAEDAPDFIGNARIKAAAVAAATGEWALADDSGLGFLGGAVVIGGLIALVALASQITKINRVALFWIAFVLTRPFGATFGDLLTKPLAQGGLDFGTIGSSLILGGLLLTFVTIMHLRERRATALGLAE